METNLFLTNPTVEHVVTLNIDMVRSITSLKFGKQDWTQHQVSFDMVRSITSLKFGKQDYTQRFQQCHDSSATVPTWSQHQEPKLLYGSAFQLPIHQMIADPDDCFNPVFSDVPAVDNGATIFFLGMGQTSHLLSAHELKVRLEEDAFKVLDKYPFLNISFINSPILLLISMIYEALCQHTFLTCQLLYVTRGFKKEGFFTSHHLHKDPGERHWPTDILNAYSAIHSAFTPELQNPKQDSVDFDLLPSASADLFLVKDSAEHSQ